MHLLTSFARLYPRQSLVVFVCLLFAALGEGLGLSTLLPLLKLAQSGGQGLGDSDAAQMLTQGLGAVHLQPTFASMTVLIIVGLFMKAGLTLMAYRQVGYTVADIATDRRLALLRALSLSRWEYFLRQRSGSLANTVSIEAARSAGAFSACASLVSLLMQAVTFLVVALLVNWEAALGALVVAFVIFSVLRQLVRMARSAGGRQQALFQALMSVLTDSLQSLKPLKAMGRETEMDQVLEGHTRDLNRAMRTEVLSREALKSIQELLIGLVLVFGVVLSLTYWGLELAGVMVLTVVLARMLTKLSKVQQAYQTLAVSESFYWSMQDSIRAAEAQAEASFGQHRPTLTAGIRMRALSFGYDDTLVLDGIDMEIPAGRFTAIIGASGAGKTTIVDLVIGLLRPRAGKMLIDGVSIEDIDIRAWRTMIGYVPQDTVLLHDTVLANVIVGSANISEARAIWALQTAGAWDFVRDLEDGLRTVVGEHGSRFSGGQRQRIVIARALVHRPKLLILDEATSALDPETERAVSETLRNLGEDYTVLAISHQPTLMELADRVYRIDGGEMTLAEDRNATVIDTA